MRFYAALSFAAVAVALPPKRDAQFGHGAPFDHAPTSWQPGPPSWQGPHGPHGQWNKAAYFLDNNAAGSSVVSMHINDDGTLSQPMRTAIGGFGAHSINATDGQPLGMDTLGSQGAVKVSGNMLFTVNSGSNSLSMFTIDPQEPWNVKMIGSPADTMGQFPISVDYSAKLKKACVMNGGAIAGVSCFSVDPYHGLTPFGSLHKLPASVINETTPPSGPPGSAAQVLFNPDSSALFATVKGNAGAAPVKLGTLAVWPISSDGEVSTAEPIANQIDGIAMDFGFQFLNQNSILLSDPSFGASILSIGSDYKATEKVHTIVPGQVAICWTASESSLNTLYAIDAGVNQIYTLDATTGALNGSIPVELPGWNATQGVFDNSILEGKMYALAATNGVLVVDLEQRKQAQYLDLSGFGVREDYQGMATWPVR